MRRCLLGVLVLSLQVASGAAPRQDSAASGALDQVVWFLTDFQNALAADADGPIEKLAARLPPDAANILRDFRSGERHAPLKVSLRERERRAITAGVVVTADVLVARDQMGRAATFDILLSRPSPQAPYEMTGLQRVAHLEGLFKLTLDTSRQFAVHNLTVSAPDLTIAMPSGVAFAASTGAGMTALVLRGRGQLHFTPKDSAEQGQMRIFARHPSLDGDVEDVFIRLNPGDVDEHITSGALSPSAMDPGQAAHAQAVFDRFLPKSYSLSLGDLSADRWSLLPPSGNVAIEFKPSRFGWLTYARSASDPEDVTLFDRDNQHNISLYSSDSGSGRSKFFDEDQSAAYDVVRYGLDVVFDPSRLQVTGRGRLRVRILSDATQSLSFRLNESLLITSVSSPDFGRLLPLRVSGQTTLMVGLPDMVTRGQEITIDIGYTGRVEPEELGELLQPDRHRVDDGPEFVQIPEPHFLYTNRSFWYPQAISTDFAVATMRLTVPAEYQIVATGEEVRSSVTPAAGDAKPMRTVEFVADRPVRYLACEISHFTPLGRARADVPVHPPAAGPSTPAVPGRSDEPGVSVRGLATPRVVGANRSLPGRAAQLLSFYAREFGAAPYPSLTVTATDALIPGGHSPGFFTLIQQPLVVTPYTWRQDPLAFDAYPDFLVAHEIAHQWWGQAIGVKSYHDQWLSEGLAQYSALAFITSEHPESERGLVTKMRSSAAAFAASGPIYLGYRLGHIEGKGAPFRAIVYNKSAIVLHMLRRLIGDVPFARGLRRFYADWTFKKASTDDLRAAFEAESGRPLGRFFDRWILGAALPRLKTSWTMDDGAKTAIVRIEQVGDVFDLPLTVSVQYEDGTAKNVQLAITEAVTDARIPLTGKVRRILTKDELTLAEYVD